MRVTIKNIEAAILEQTGDAAKLARGEGYYYFYADDEALALEIAGWPQSGVYVFCLGSYSIKEWVQRYIDLKQAAKQARF